MNCKDSTEELISIIVVTYNSAKTVIDTLESISRQDYHNIEIVLTDDASKDYTIEIAREWKNKNQYEPMQIITVESNTGVTKNVNRGLAKCKGKLFKIIAGDDTLAPNAIRLYYNAYHEFNPQVIGMAKVRLWGDVTNTQREYCDNSYKMVQLTQSEQYKQMLIMNFITAPSVGLIGVEDAKKIGAFDERYPAFEDYPFFLKLLRNGYSFKLIDAELVNYRIAANSVGNGMSWRYLKSMANFFFQVRLKYQLEEGMYKTAAKQFIRYSYYMLLAFCKQYLHKKDESAT